MVITSVQLFQKNESSHIDTHRGPTGHCVAMEEKQPPTGSVRPVSHCGHTVMGGGVLKPKKNAPDLATS